MLGYWRRSTSASPYASYSVHGTTVAASPQPHEPYSKTARSVPRATSRTFGTTAGTAPSSRWSAARSASQLARKARLSALAQAAGEKTMMSPVQPSRSSRCGQSLGMARKLPRWDQVTLRNSWLTLSSEQAKVPVTSRSEDTTATSTSSTTTSGEVSMSAYRNPWKVKAGSSAVGRVSASR